MSQYYDSAYSPNVEARFAMRKEWRLIAVPTGEKRKDANGNEVDVKKKEKREVEQIICYSRVKGQKDESEQVLDESNFDELTDKYQAAYRAFKGEEVVEAHGTPIEELFPNDMPGAQFMRSLGFRTVEYFASAPENVARSAGLGWMRKQEEAKELIAQRNNRAVVSSASEPKFDNPLQRAAWEQAVANLKAQFEGAVKAGQFTVPATPAPEPVEATSAIDEEKPKQRRGRPPKVKETEDA